MPATFTDDELKTAYDYLQIAETMDETGMSEADDDKLYRLILKIGRALGPASLKKMGFNPDIELHDYEANPINPKFP